MTATAAKYRSPYVSEILRETDGSLNDCAVSTGIMLLGDWTLGEALTRADGKPKDVLFLREWSRKQLGPGAQDGGLTLHDMNDLMHAIDPDLPPLPRYNGQSLRPGQSSEGATLRITFETLKSMLKNGHSAALCGNPSGVSDPNSPLRTKQNRDDYAHVVHITDGNDKGAILKDPLTRRKPGWPGERVSWEDLRQFTEAKKDGERQFGSPTAIACAVIRVGDETEAERARRKASSTITKLQTRLDAQKAQTALATEERDQARRDLAACQAAQPQPVDCSAEIDRALTAERKLDDIRAVLSR